MDSLCVTLYPNLVCIQIGPEAVPEGGAELAGPAALSEPQCHTS